MKLKASWLPLSVANAHSLDVDIIYSKHDERQSGKTVRCNSASCVKCLFYFCIQYSSCSFASFIKPEINKHHRCQLHNSSDRILFHLTWCYRKLDNGLFNSRFATSPYMYTVSILSTPFNMLDCSPGYQILNQERLKA